MVTGTSVLAVSTDATVLRYFSVALYALLVTAWVTVATRTARGALRGDIFLPAPVASAVAPSI